jgi:multidrug efflux pump subunit AcrB
VEKRVAVVLGDSNPIVESVIANVALSASEDMFDAGRITSNRGKITINFVEYSKRHGERTTPYIDRLREVVKDIPGAEITVDKEANGPPVGKPVNIEVSSEDFNDLISTTNNLIRFLDSLEIDGIEELKSDFQNNKPELIVVIDRERANREGISIGQIGGEVRTAILGNEASKFREDEEQYPVQLRYSEYQRKNINRLMNLKITYMDMTTGMLRRIPLSSVASVTYQNTYGGINRKDLKRVITVYSNLLSGYNSNEVNAEIRQALKYFNKPMGVEIAITGEQEDQKENSIFLSKAMLFSLFLVMFILITQFNSVSKPFIIITEVLFSIIGVLLGFGLFRLPYSIIMTGIGIVALAGIVVRNGILLVEFTDILKEKGSTLKKAIIEAGKIRITPIVLTATATILGLVPLSVGFNINFGTLLTELNPQIHFGGDMVAFFGPLAWTIIFGLSFATFLTLLLIPAMYYILYAAKTRIRRIRQSRRMNGENNA